MSVVLFMLAVASLLPKHAHGRQQQQQTVAAAETGDDLLAKRSHGAAKELISLLAAL